MSEQTKTDRPMTPIEQVREAGNAMRHWAERTYEEADRVARGYRVLEPLNSATESLKKRIKEWDRALSLLKTMEGEPVAISIRQDVQTIDMLCRIHKVIQEFREPTRKTVFYCPVGGQAERLAELHDELDLWLKTETIRATDPSPQSDTLTTLPLSMTEEQIERIGREQYPPDTTNDGEPWYNHEQATRNMYFKDGLRYASTHTKTITVDQIVEVAKRSRKCMRCSGEGRFYDPSGSCRWADCADCHGNGSDLHELLTSKFK